MRLALVIALCGLVGCAPCTYMGKAVGCEDAKNMKNLGMNVVCHDDDCGKTPK